MEHLRLSTPKHEVEHQTQDNGDRRCPPLPSLQCANNKTVNTNILLVVLTVLRLLKNSALFFSKDVEREAGNVSSIKHTHDA
jgi:hypothetical protein